MRDTKMIILAVGSTAVGLGLMVASVMSDTPLTDRVQNWVVGGVDAYQQEIVLVRDLALEPGGRLQVMAYDADVHVSTGAHGGHLSVAIGGRDLEWARQVFDRMRFDVTVDANTLTIRSHDPELGASDWQKHGGVETQITVHLPEHFDVSVQTGDGDVVTGDLQGTIDIRTGDGDISLGGALGESVTLQTGDGDVAASRVETERLVAATGDGDVALAGVIAQHTEVRTGDGDVALARLSGAADIDAGDGDVIVGLESQTPLTVQTVDGDIVITVPESVGFDLDLTGSDVSTPSLMVPVDRAAPGRTRGTIHGGGPIIRATTTDGSVIIGLRTP